MKTLVALAACLVLLGAIAVAPTAAADHAPVPLENPCLETYPERTCVVSDDGWCWIWYHCPW